jgi:hypothetical protein
MVALRHKSSLERRQEEAFHRYQNSKPRTAVGYEASKLLAADYAEAEAKARAAGDEETADRIARKREELLARMETKVDMSKGKAIADAFKKEAARIGGEMARLADDDGRDGGWKARRRMELRRELEATRRHADAAVSEWAEEVRADAERRYAEDPVGSAADESRRVANEMKAARLARSAGDSKRKAEDLLERSRELFNLGRFEEAIVYADACEATGQSLPGVETARQAPQTALDLKVPVRRQAIQDRNAATIASAVFAREAEVMMASVAEHERQVAARLGDAEGQSDALRHAAEASFRAKQAETQAASLEGREAQTPIGLMTASTAEVAG